MVKTATRDAARRYPRRANTANARYAPDASEPAHGQSMRGATSRPGVERAIRGGRADQRLDSVRNRAGRAQQGLLYQQLM